MNTTITPNSSSTKREIGLFSLSCMVIASMIGAGVYTTSGFALADLGSPWLVLAAWAVGGLIAICGAVAFGQLVEAFDENGGEYLYLSRCVHPVAGFIAGWISMLAGFTGAAALAAMTFEQYALSTQSRPHWLPPGSLALVLTIACTSIHAVKTRPGLLSQNAAVILKLILLAVFLVLAFSQFHVWDGGAKSPSAGDLPTPNWMTFAGTVMWISLSYSGFNAAIYVAGESERGGKTVALAMVIATVVVTLIYLAINVVFLFGPPAESIAGKQDIAAIAAKSIGGLGLSQFVRLAVCIGLATSVSSILVSGPRVYAKMARDGLLPATVNRNTSPPTRLVLLQGFAIIVLIQSSTLQGLLSYLGMTLALSAAATVALCGYRRWKLNVQTACSLIYALATLFIACIAGWNRPTEAIAFLATIASGGLMYFFTIHPRRSKKASN